jgi:hypothetical protein
MAMDQGLGPIDGFQRQGHAAIGFAHQEFRGGPQNLDSVLSYRPLRALDIDRWVK